MLLKQRIMGVCYCFGNSTQMNYTLEERSVMYYLFSIPSRILLAGMALLSSIYFADDTIIFSVIYLVFAAVTIIVSFVSNETSKENAWSAPLRTFHAGAWVGYGIVSLFKPHDWWYASVLFVDIFVSITYRLLKVPWKELDPAIHHKDVSLFPNVPGLHWLDHI